VWAPFELQPYGAESVYVEYPGQLVEMNVEPGQRVEKGDLIARLENLNLELAIAELEGQRESYRVQLEGLRELRYERSRTAEAANLATVVEKQLAATEDNLKQKQTELAQLRIVAPASGMIIPPPRTPERPRDDAMQLVAYSGTPLDQQNMGATLTPDGPQSLLCQIGDPHQWEAVLVIDQDDVDLVKGGETVRLMLDESAYHVFVSTVTKPADDALKVAPPRLASTAGGPLAAQADPDGTVRPLNTSFQAIARLDNSTGLLRNGLTGRARIETRPRTIAERLYRYFTRTFNFDL
jgi:putative peptide zinc metalloprotease protein